MNVFEYIRNKAFRELGLMPNQGGPAADEADTFVNDRDAVRLLAVREYDVWYDSNDSELLNFYTKQETIDYAYEPWFWRNKDCYFWCVASTENDIKRTTTGLPRDIVDTLVNVTGYPTVQHSVKAISDDLNGILKTSGFWERWHDMQMPMTLVEGWGAWRVAWDTKLSNKPFAEYYTAENVDFIVNRGFIIGIIFKNWYDAPDGKRFLVTETRRKTFNAETHNIDLIVETEAFETDRGDKGQLRHVLYQDVPQLQGVEQRIVFQNFNKLLATPCVFFADPSGRMYGRSIYSGKISLFDDLDQNRSQDANSVRSSSVQKTFDQDFLERDPITKLPIQPKVFDLKFLRVKGQRNENGASQSSSAIEIKQPQLNFAQYSTDEMAIVTDILQGVLSPATLGIDVAKRDNGDAQREKEKVTIFTRNAIIRKETDILKSVFSDILVANEYLKESNVKGEITVKDYSDQIDVNFPEFADASYENKLKVLSDAYGNGALSPDEYVTQLYGSSISEDRRQSLIKFLEDDKKSEREAQINSQTSPFDNGNGNEDDEVPTPVQQPTATK